MLGRINVKKINIKSLLRGQGDSDPQGKCETLEKVPEKRQKKVLLRSPLEKKKPGGRGKPK